MESFNNPVLLSLFIVGTVIFFLGLGLYLWSKKESLKRLGITLLLAGIGTALITYLNGGML